MKRFQLAIGLGDDRQLPDYVGNFCAGNGVIVFIISDLGLDARQFQVTLLQRTTEDTWR
jgi:hypothetical protein